MKKLKEELKYGKKGITLISLVVTIIVLLILASVTIATLTGDNGILTRAAEAKNKTENAAKKEEEDLAKLEAIITGQDIPIVQVDDKNPGQLEQENDNIFVINSIEDLIFFSYDVTTNGNKYENQTVKLGTNLDFASDKSYVNPNSTDYEEYGYSGQIKQALTSGNGFSSIGSQSSDVGTNHFYGTFDGDNKAICSLYINMDSDKGMNIGFFNVAYGIIENLGIVNANIIVEASYTSVGGLAGRSYNNIYNCYTTGNINVTGSSWMPVGGICGTMYNGGDIINSYNLATIECKNICEKQGNNNISCGGIVGQVEGEEANIDKCFNKGNITANGGNTTVSVGGITGTLTYNGNNCSLKNCYNNAKIQGKSSTVYYLNYVGGIAGLIKSATVSNCYNIGEIVGSKNENETSNLSAGIGGIIGLQSSNTEINNIFNIGKIICKNNGTNLNVGGIVGKTEDEATSKINNVYNTGSIEANELNSSQVGSIAGSDLITFSNCYYLKGTYGIGVAGNETVTGVTQWDSIEDFPTVLSIINEKKAFKEDTNNINNGYPIFTWQ